MSSDEFLKEFKQDCISNDPEIVVQKYLVDGSSYFFNTHHSQHAEFEFKKSLALTLSVHLRDVAIVGSGKLGFSIKPDPHAPGLYEFNKFDKKYEADPSEEKSDLDVAIISRELFDAQLEELYRFTTAYKNDAFSPAGFKSFAKYTLRGWIRPDLLPMGYSIAEGLGVTSQRLSSLYQRSVNIGIYKSWYYFEQYHVGNVHNLSVNLIGN